MAIGGAQELLTFLITANGQQAIREVNQVNKAFARQEQVVGAANRKTAAAFATTAAKQAGIAAAAGAAVVAAAGAANDLDKSFSRLDATFGQGAESVKEWARGANDIFLSDRQAAAYAANVGEAAQGLGLAADEASRLVPEVIGVTSQLATLKGLDMDNSIESISAALRGEFDATQKLVPALSAARIQREALAQSGKENVKDLSTAEKAYATLNIILSDGQQIIAGNAEALDDLGAKWARLKSNLDDAVSAFGAGALGPVEGLASALEGITEAGTNGSANLLRAAGAASTVGVAAFGATAGVNALGAGALKMAERFGASETRLAGISRAFSGLARVTGVVGAVAAVGTAFYELTNDAEGAAEAVTAFIAAQEDQQRIDALAEGLGKLDGGFEDVLETLSLAPRAITGGISALLGGDASQLDRAVAQYVELEGALAALGSVDLYDLEAFLEGVAQTDPAGTLEFIEILRDSLPEAGAGADIAREKIDGVEDSINNAAGAAENLGETGAADGLGEVGEAAEAAGEQLEVAATAAERLDNALSAYGSIESVTNAMADAAEAAADIATAQEDLNTAREGGKQDEIVAAESDLAEALREQEGAYIDLLGSVQEVGTLGPQAVADLKRAILTGVDSGLIPDDVAKRTIAQIDTITAHAESNPIDLEANIDPANNTLTAWADRAREGTVNVEVDADPLPADNTLLGWAKVVSERVAVTNLDADPSEATSKYDLYYDVVTGDIIEVPVGADTSSAEGEYGSIEARIEAGTVIPVDADTTAASNKISSLDGRTISLNVRTIGVNLNQLGAAGGPGAVTVLPDGGIMGPGVVPLTELIGAYARNSSGSSGESVGTKIQNQTIILPRGADAREVELAQRRYTARNGTPRR